ncbi:MAG: F0F1 ATP synthase subunit B [Candidatus Pacebacteria bacterium]|nr:F0F1 ATP synthase subunit B [Candidatus Paceibacterota bacterium]
MEVLTNIGFDWQVALANFINFMIILFIMKKYVFGPTGAVIKKRQEKIQEGIDNAKNSESELLVAKQKSEEELKKARNEANQIIAKAKENGDDLVARAQKEADGKVDEVMAQAQKNIEKQKEQMETELLEKTAGLVTLGVSKILNEDIDNTKNESISKRALEALKQS